MTEEWAVEFTRKAAKQRDALPIRWRKVLNLLVTEIEKAGPVRGSWPNYSKLGSPKDKKHHCHLNKRGNPTYVAVWQVVNGRIRMVEVIYVGTREGAPY